MVRLREVSPSGGPLGKWELWFILLQSAQAAKVLPTHLCCIFVNIDQPWILNKTWFHRQPDPCDHHQPSCRPRQNLDVYITWNDYTITYHCHIMFISCVVSTAVSESMPDPWWCDDLCTVPPARIFTDFTVEIKVSVFWLFKQYDLLPQAIYFYTSKQVISISAESWCAEKWSYPQNLQLAYEKVVLGVDCGVPANMEILMSVVASWTSDSLQAVIDHLFPC